MTVALVDSNIYLQYRDGARVKNPKSSTNAICVPTTKAVLPEEKYEVHTSWLHTIRKCKKMAGQNTFQILLLNDANMI